MELRQTKLNSKEKGVKPFVVIGDEMYSVLDRAYNSFSNVIFWGPGGHAKSDVTREWAYSHFNKEDVFIKTMSRGTKISEILGGLDLDALDGNKDGKKRFQYNTENSFMNYKIAILEEALDMDMDGLCILKDILMSKTFNNGTQVVPLKTEMVIINTNRDPYALAQDEPAYEAFFDRFQVKYQVKWKNYSIGNYQELVNHYNKLFGGVFKPNVLAALATYSSTKSGSINPRALYFAMKHIYCNAFNPVSKEELGPSSLIYLKDMPDFAEMAKVSESEAASMKKNELARKELEQIEQEFINIQSTTKNSGVSRATMATSVTRLNSLKDRCNSISITDSLFGKRRDLITKIESLIKEIGV